MAGRRRPEVDTAETGWLLSPTQRAIISERTRAALAVKRSQGVRLGRPPVLPDAVVFRIIDAYEAGQSWSAIGRALDADAVPTAQGGARWYPSTVRAVFMANVTVNADVA